MKFGVFTLGCKVNQYESTAIISTLKGLGYEATNDFCYADFYIINTCSITAEADKKSRQMVARALRQNPVAKVVILGCSSENNPDFYTGKDNVIAVLGTTNKTQKIIEIAKQLEQEFMENHADFAQAKDITNDKQTILDAEENSRARAYLKVQDGCNNFCSYCIVPYLRGRSRSRDISEIVNEAQKLSLATEEIVITGINISDYNYNNQTLGDLVIALRDIPARKRLGSLECNIITESFLKNMKTAGFCDHFHLSLQSGSDSVLKSMNRHYIAADFLEKIKMIRSFFPYAGITTDVITAFSTETEENHNETVKFVKSAEFSDIHVFPYSRREGTKAASLPTLAKCISDARATELAKIKQELKTQFYKKNLNRELKVFIEDSEDGCNVGYTSNYIKVFSKAGRHSFFTHRLTEIHNINGMNGEIIE